MAKLSAATDDDDGPMPSGRTARRTRSQSVEAIATRPPPRRGGRAARARDSSPPQKRRRNAVARVAVQPSGLGPVLEDSHHAQAQLDAQRQGRNLEHEQEPHRHRERADGEHADASPETGPRRVSDGEYSVISGTTAKTSFSQEEAEMMDSDMIVDVLPTLVAACEDLAKVLLPSGDRTTSETWKDIRRSGSKSNKIYRNRTNAINIHRPTFGTQEFVSPRILLRALLGVADTSSLPDAPWRPDKLVYKINLVQMLNTVLAVCEPDNWTIDHTDRLERLHTAFPDSFTAHEFDFDALFFYLQISAQVVIRRIDTYIESEPNFSPHAVIDGLFFGDEDALLFADRFGLETADAEDRAEAVENIRHIVDELKRPFSEASEASAVTTNGQLKAKYSWDSFRKDAISYFAARTNDLNAQILQIGGMKEILKGLAAESERRAHERSAEQIRKSIASSSSMTRKSFGAKEDLAVLLSKERQVVERAQRPATSVRPTQPHDVSSAPETVHESFRDHPILESEDEPEDKRDDEPVVGLPAPGRYQDVISQIVQRPGGKDKARLIDPQADASRVSPIRDFDGSYSERHEITVPVLSRPIKRTHDQLEEDDEDFPDPTQDEGFQVDQPDRDAVARRRLEVTFAGPEPRASRPEPSMEDEYSSPAQPPRSTAASNVGVSQRERQNPGSALPPPIQPLEEDADALPSSGEYERARILAKQNRVSGPKPPKEQPLRRKWLDEHEEHLLHLIEEYGVSWAYLKNIDQQNGNVLEGRSAENIRQKAREMKTTILLARKALPRNWDKVPLDKKAIDRLRDSGITYEQQRQRAMPRRTTDGDS